MLRTTIAATMPSYRCSQGWRPADRRRPWCRGPWSSPAERHRMDQDGDSDGESPLDPIGRPVRNLEQRSLPRHRQS